jgi:hypothetical protein
MNAAKNQRRVAYHSWLSASRDARYWERLASRADTIDSYLSIATGVLSSAALLSLLLGASNELVWPSWGRSLAIGSCSLISAVLSFYGSRKTFAKQAAKYAMLQGLCTQLAGSWKRVVDNIYARRVVSRDLILELQLRTENLAAYEAGHHQNDKIAAMCEREVREMESLFVQQLALRKERHAESKQAGA